MTTDPSTPPPRPPLTNPRPTAAQQRVLGRPATRVVTVSSPGPLIGAVATLVLGVLLGLANQAADGTDMMLRVPALLAALLMVAQGAYDFKRHLPRRAVVEDTGTMVVEDGDTHRPTELARVRPLPQPSVSPVTVRPTPATLSVPIGVMVLAAWLGLADLRVEAPPSLALLSLIAAFALFALGWTLLPARR